MGGTLGKIFNSEGGGGKSSVDIFLDFEKAQPNDGKEKVLYDEVHAALTEGQTILTDIAGYRGCEEFIRQALAKPSPENDKAAWGAIVPAVNLLRIFYEFSKKLEVVFPKLLSALCSDNAKDSLNTQQALAKQLADIFDFVLRFDDAKMINPGIQNDFSYYRRNMSRMKQNKETAADLIADDIANRISLFLAYPTPMMKALTDLTAADKTVAVDNVITGLSLMANVCHDMVSKRKFTNVNTNMFCLRAMTGCVVLVDHISPLGAFSKKSTIFMKGIITVLKTFTDAPTDGMLNALRFNTKHLNDAETPSNIKQLLQ